MALRDTTPPRFSRSPHLVALVAEVERLAATVAAAPEPERRQLGLRRADEVVRATLTLDGAEGDALPGPDEAAAALAAAVPVAPDPADRRGSWLDALRVFDTPSDREIRALEVLGARAGDASDDLVAPLLNDPGPTLSELHRRLTRGLVAEHRAGAPRVTEQAVHDGSTGRVVFFTTEPADVPSELALLEAWLASTGTREHGLIVSGVLHLELLRIHPFDAANGRLARAASRLVLRGRGLDPDHLAVPEPTLARDAMGYVEEVARTRRRRDLTIWLERWGEAVADGLRSSARRLRMLDVEVDAEAAAFVVARPAFTVADHRADLTLTPAEGREQLQRLLDSGLVVRQPGTRGLRFTAAAG
jgi:fido (protein-threonine AMPylation protein)